MVPDWPENQSPEMIPAKSTSLLPEASPHKLLPQTAPPQQPLRQRKITELPLELLAMIFDYLEFDDIRRVNATCLAFRDVVKGCNYIQELSFFTQLPRSFRKQYQQHALGQKKSLYWHPFAYPAPLNGRGISFRDRIIKNLPQMTALLCRATLRRMEASPSYHPVERYKVTLPQRAQWYLQPQTGAPLEVCFSPSSRRLLFYGRCLNDSRILARDDQGQWAEEHLKWSDNSGSRVVTRANFSACENRLLTWNGESCVNRFRSAHSGWDRVGKATLPGHKVLFSPSGKYMMAYKRGSFTVYCMDENNKWQKMPVLGLSGALVNHALFSPSEQYLAVLWTRPPAWASQMSILSLDQGSGAAWNADWLATCRHDHIVHFQFSKVADQLLVGITEGFTNPARVSIYSREPSGKWEETIIFPYYWPVYLSTAGQYVFARGWFMGRDMLKGRSSDRDLLLWRIPEKLSDGSLNHGGLSQPDAISKAILDSVIMLKHSSPLKCAQFSPSDNHLVTSCESGEVYIWGKSQAGQWAIETITGECAPTPTPWFSPSGLHVLTYNPSMVGIFGRSDEKRWLPSGCQKSGN